MSMELALDCSLPASTSLSGYRRSPICVEVEADILRVGDISDIMVHNVVRRVDGGAVVDMLGIHVPDLLVIFLTCNTHSAKCQSLNEVDPGS